jgi:hypothetical protein
VLILWDGCEEASDVFVVAFELCLSVRENKEGGIRDRIPSGGPFAMHCDLLSWSARACRDLNVSDLLGLFSVPRDTEKAGEDMVEVNRVSRDKVCLFRDGEL